MNFRSLTVAATLATLLTMNSSPAATWQYQVPLDSGRAAKDGQAQPGNFLLWLPPELKTVRGLLVGGKLRIELEIALDPEVRKACADSGLGIVYFSPHISGTFHYWEEGNTDAARWLKAFDDLAARSGHPELRRVPWTTMGHSTAGIFCRNVAYWKPDRVASVVHVKSGNFHQKSQLPPEGSLAGVPLVAINGQLETYGPEGGIRAEFGRQTQWIFVGKDIEKFHEKDANHLMSQWLDLGGDHFHGSPELSKYVALFLRKTARYRLPAELPKGDDPVRCLPLKSDDGWLTDPDLADPKHKPGAFRDYTGDRRAALWHYDEEIARATAQHHRNLDKHQCLSPAESGVVGRRRRLDLPRRGRLARHHSGELRRRHRRQESRPFRDALSLSLQDRRAGRLPRKGYVPAAETDQDGELRGGASGGR